jgi:MFS family permease
MSNQNDDNAGCISVIVFVILLPTGLFIWGGGFQFLKEIISNPQTVWMLELDSSGYYFEDDRALLWLITICIWLGFISFLFGWIAMKIEKNIQNNRRPVAIKATISILSMLSFTVSIIMFLLLARYVDIFGENIFPASNNLVWKGSNERVTMEEQRGVFGRLMMYAVFLGITILTVLPAIYAVKSMIKNSKRQK